LVGLAAAAVMGAEAVRALKAAHTPTAQTGRAQTALGATSGSPLAHAAAESMSQYAPRPQHQRRAASRSASSIAKLSCQHTVRLHGRPSEVLGWAFVKCPQCGVNVTVLDAEPARRRR